MGFFKSLVDGVKDNLTNQIQKSIGEGIKENFKSHLNSKSKEEDESEVEEFDFEPLSDSIQVFGVSDLKVKYNGEKYSVVKMDDDEEEGETGFIYDDVAAMSPYHIKIAQNQKDGKVLYGVACSFAKRYVTSCEYIDVKFFDGDSLLIIDEDMDEYVIDRWGHITNKNKFLQDLVKKLQKKKQETEEESDDYDEED